MPSRKGKNLHHASQASPETLDLRPETGLTLHEQEHTKTLVKRLIQGRRDNLPPKAWLTKAMKEAIYAEVARSMSADCQRLISPEQVQLVAMTARARKSKPTDFMLRLFEHHHTLIEAEAEAEGINMKGMAQRIFDAYFGLDPTYSASPL